MKIFIKRSLLLLLILFALFAGAKTLETANIPGVIEASAASDLKPTLSVTSQTENAITLKWTACRNATKYRVFVKVGERQYNALGDTTATTYTVKNLKPGTKYTFVVSPFMSITWGAQSSDFTTCTKPEKTTGLKSAAQSTNAIKLTWNKVAGATGYRIYRYDAKTRKYVSVGYIPGKTQYNINKLSVGTKYKFKVRAYINTDQGAVWGEYSDALLTATKPAKTTGLKSTAQSTTAIKLAWNKVSGATGYRIYKYNAKSKKYESVGYIPGKTEFTVSKLTEGTKYQFVVRAYINTDLGAVWGDYSGALTVSTKSANKIKLTANQSETAIKLTWTKASGVAGYRVCYKSGNKWKKYVDTTATSYTIKNLKSGTKYTFMVATLIKKSGKIVLGANSNSLITATKPATPTLKVTSTVAGKATLSWTNVNGETAYEIYYSIKKDSGYKKAGEVKADVTKVILSKLTPGKAYYFRVRAYIKLSDSIIYGGYKTVGVKVKTTSEKLTNAKALEIWQKANYIHNQWYMHRHSEGYVDNNTSIKYNGYPYFLIRHDTIDSKADLKKYLRNYFDDEICDRLLNEYIDYNGELYARILARGGDYRTFEKLSIKSQTENYAELIINYKGIQSEPDSSNVQKMKIENGKWIFVEAFYGDC